MNEKQIEEIMAVYETPLYVFEESVLKKRIAYLRENLPREVGFCYAVKANTFIADKLIESVERYEVCSPGEIYICRDENIPYEKMVISGVYKTPEVIEELFRLKAKTLYTIESMRQYELLKELSSKYHCRINVLLRLTSGNQFGLNEDEVREIIGLRDENTAVNIQGLQYFSGTQKVSLKRLKREIEYVDRFMKSITEDSGFVIKELEFGPGLPVHYFQGDGFDEGTFLKGFSELLENMDYKAQITLEMGRSIAASCGSYFTKVVDTKHSKGQNYAIMDGGVHQLVYFGQSMAMQYPCCEVYPKRSGGETKSWNLCGCLCTGNDILVKQIPLQDFDVGDIVMFKNTGAYCMTEGMALFLSRSLPGIVIIDENNQAVCVREAVNVYEFNAPDYM